MRKLQEEIAKKIYIISNDLLKDYYGISPDPFGIETRLLHYKGIFEHDGWVFKSLQYIFLDAHKIEYLPKFALINGSLFIYKNKIKTLKGRLPQKEIKGDLRCEENNLFSLEGCPKKVGYLNCTHNQLKNLKGGPEEVTKHYRCEHNKLVSLQGAARKVGGDFNCEDNKLRDLKGLPKVIGGSLFCARNPLRDAYIPTGTTIAREVHRDISEEELANIDDLYHNINWAEFAELYFLPENSQNLHVYNSGALELVPTSQRLHPDDLDGCVAVIETPGIGNLDSYIFTEGFVVWDEDQEVYVVDDDLRFRRDGGRVVGDLEDVIQEVIDEGDIEAFIDDWWADIRRQAREGGCEG